MGTWNPAAPLDATLQPNISQLASRPQSPTTLWPWKNQREHRNPSLSTANGLLTPLARAPLRASRADPRPPRRRLLRLGPGLHLGVPAPPVGQPEARHRAPLRDVLAAEADNHALPLHRPAVRVRARRARPRPEHPSRRQGRVCHRPPGQCIRPQARLGPVLPRNQAQHHGEARRGLPQRRLCGWLHPQRHGPSRPGDPSGWLRQRWQAHPLLLEGRDERAAA